MAASIQTSTTDTAATTKHPSKRRKLTTDQHQNHQEQPLIPGLPDHVAQICLSHVHPSTLYTVCHPWRRLIYSLSFPPFLSLYAVLSSTSTNHHLSNTNPIQSFSFDPISSKWDPLPLPPPDPPLHLLIRHPCFISRHLPIQSISVSGRLILIAATSHNFSPALSHPLVFNPLSGVWGYGPPLTTPRRWCAAGAAHDTVYVASGIGSQFNTGVARSAEKWDLESKNVGISTIANKTITWKWKRVKELKDGRFCRDAIDAVGWRGKLCMVNMKGDAPKEGISYDTKKDAWENMPEGMLAGWRGPVASMDEETMYVVDEAKGVLRKYDPEKDYWEHMMESERLVGAQKIAAGGGRVCAICGCSTEIVVLDVAALPVKLWVVKTPPGLEALAIHILPRMTRPDF
ncbi:F-BOX/KELCH-REPEAT PROTEIN SKIP25 [Salix koriyanagi]|uniref:F-BOX/KELCH-REPEAT PROTEIN SKIP25 n=1 Tax=Salix koriyanagi TaxID=2511006 RepID=A0A9Q1ANM2_9ROSI|nr:F-BOX/KELCH-REPEAT PROTEIN SKIP25 [Salix koriyanagi]